MDKQILMMVGPSGIPQRVLKAMNRPAISHRSAEYSVVQKRATENLKKVFNTENSVIPLTCSGTGAMETSLVNCFSAGDKVVVPVVGWFSKQFADMADAFGLDVKRVEFELGETADVDKVMAEVEEDTAGVLLVHNESSTGVFNDLEAFGERLKDTETLLIVDSVSGLGGLEMRMDDWNIDVALSSSQKCLMSPPGLGFIALSDKAWDRVEKSTLPKYYFDLKSARKINDEANQTPSTTAVYTMFASDEALQMVDEEGIDNVYKRHIANSKKVIEGVKAMGLELLAKDEKFASPSLTCVKVPGKAKEVVRRLADKSIIINEGLAPLDEDTFRVGTMGYVSEYDVLAFLYELENIIKEI